METRVGRIYIDLVQWGRLDAVLVGEGWYGVGL